MQINSSRNFRSVSSFGYKNLLKSRLSPQFLKTIPTTPGVYFMLDEDNSILYIGKAKNLRNRLSSYFLAKPGIVPERTLEMIDSIRAIRFQSCASELDAIVRETDLIHAVRPPYNIVGSDPAPYLFIGTRQGLVKQNSLAVDFQLSSFSRMKKAGYEIYGCFKNRSKIKAGYTALLRLFYAASAQSPRFSYPARITRVSPPWIYKSQISPDWKNHLDCFLRGKSMKLIHVLFQTLLENESIPPFMRPSLHDDLIVVKSFYKYGPKSTYNLKAKYGIKLKTLSMKQMDQLVLSNFESDFKVDFKANFKRTA